MQAKFVPRPNFLFLKDDSDNGTIVIPSFKGIVIRSFNLEPFMGHNDR